MARARQCRPPSSSDFTIRLAYDVRIRSIESETVKTHAGIDRHSLMMARRIAAKIDSDAGGEGLAHARKVCARWVEKGNVPAKEWMVILQRPWPEIRSILLDDSEEGNACVRAILSAEC